MAMMAARVARVATDWAPTSRTQPSRRTAHRLRVRLSVDFSSALPCNCPATKITKRGGVESRVDAQTIVTLHHSRKASWSMNHVDGQDVRQDALWRRKRDSVPVATCAARRAKREDHSSRHRRSASDGRWRRERDSNPRNRFRFSGFQDHRHRPLGHPSASKIRPEFARVARIETASPVSVTVSVTMGQQDDTRLGGA